MKFFFIILICFTLGNLNYHIFFQKDSSLDRKISVLPFEKTETPKELKRKENDINRKNIEEKKHSNRDLKKNLEYVLEDQINNKNIVQNSVHINSSSDTGIDDNFKKRPLIQEEDFFYDQELFLEDETLAEGLGNGFYQNKKLKISKRRDQIKSKLKHLFSKDSYPRVKKISSLKGFNVEKGSLTFYPWGWWGGQYLGHDGKMRKIILKLTRKKNNFKEMVKFNLLVGKHRNIHLLISKNLPLKITNDKGFLNSYHYFSFSINKQLRLVLFKDKNKNVFKGMIKYKNRKKEKLIGTLRLKKINKNKKPAYRRES